MTDAYTACAKEAVEWEAIEKAKNAKKDMRVQMTGRYVHKDGKEMILVSASTPEHEDFIELWDQFPAEGFREVWRGTWNEFQKQWTLKGSPEQLELATK